MGSFVCLFWCRWCQSFRGQPSLCPEDRNIPAGGKACTEFHRVTPCVPVRMLPREQTKGAWVSLCCPWGCHDPEMLLGERLHLSESKVKPLENREQLCSLQTKEWFSSASKSASEFFKFHACPQKQITRFVFNPKSSFGIIWMHPARGLQNRRVSLRAPSPASAAVSGI